MKNISFKFDRKSIQKAIKIIIIALIVLILALLVCRIYLKNRSGPIVPSDLVAFLEYTFIVLIFSLIVAIVIGSKASESASKALFDGQPAKMAKFHSRAKILKINGEYEEAIAEYNLAIEADPEDTDAWLEMIDIYYYNLSQHEKALEIIEKVLTINIGEDLWTSLANRKADIFLNHFTNKEKATATLQEIITRYPSRPCAQRAKERIGRIR